MQKLKPNAVIRTPRLILREIADEDKEDMLAILTNEEVGKTFMLPVFACQEEAIPLFEKIKGLSAQNTRFVYGISLNEKLIGFINDVEIEDGRVELGYVIHPDYQNKGYATETLAAAIEALFQAGISTVETGAFEENLASMRVMEKCGMHPVSRTDSIEYRGETHACVYYQKTTHKG